MKTNQANYTRLSGLVNKAGGSQILGQQEPASK